MEKRRRETENGLGRQKTTGNSDDIKLRERKKKQLVRQEHERLVAHQREFSAFSRFEKIPNSSSLQSTAASW